MTRPGRKDTNSGHLAIDDLRPSRGAARTGRGVDRLLADFGHQLPTVPAPPGKEREPRLFEQLSRRVARVAVFRPVVRAEASTGDVHDYVLDLLVSHDAVALTYDECAGVSYDDVHADPDGAMERIVARYHQVAEKSDAVVIVGSDYTDVGAPAEFAFNARVAANLGVPVLLVLNGDGRDVEQLRTSQARFAVLKPGQVFEI